MSRGREGAAPWAATSVPEVRRRWCNALDATVQRHSEGLAPVDAPSSTMRRYERLRVKLAAPVQMMQTEADPVRQAQLYWVSRDMVDLV